MSFTSTFYCAGETDSGSDGVPGASTPQSDHADLDDSDADPIFDHVAISNDSSSSSSESDGGKLPTYCVLLFTHS